MMMKIYFYLIGIVLIGCSFSIEEVVVSLEFPPEFELIKNLTNLDKYEICYPNRHGEIKKISCTKAHFPIEIKIPLRTNTPILIYPPLNFTPAGAVFPWILLDNLSPSILQGWIAKQMISVYTTPSLPTFNYLKALNYIEDKMSSQAIQTIYELDFNRFRRDLRQSRVNSFSFRSLDFIEYLPKNSLENAICLDLNFVPLSGEKQGTIYLPEGLISFIKPKEGVLISLFIDKKKQPPVLEMKSDISSLLY